MSAAVIHYLLIWLRNYLPLRIGPRVTQSKTATASSPLLDRGCAVENPQVGSRNRRNGRAWHRRAEIQGIWPLPKQLPDGPGVSASSPVIRHRESQDHSQSNTHTHTWYQNTKRWYGIDTLTSETRGVSTGSRGAPGAIPLATPLSEQRRSRGCAARARTQVFTVQTRAQDSLWRSSLPLKSAQLSIPPLWVRPALSARRGGRNSIA